MADFPYPSNKRYSSNQVNQLITQALQDAQNGYSPGLISNIAQTMQSIVAAESVGGQTGIVNNTAAPSAPEYTAPTPGDSPEFSVGLYQINLYSHYNEVAQVLGQPQIAQGATPSDSQMYSLGQMFAGNPQAQSQIAAGLIASDHFSDWTDSFVDNYPGGPEGLWNTTVAGQVVPTTYSGGAASTSTSTGASPADSQAGGQNAAATATGVLNNCDKTVSLIGEPGVLGVGSATFLNQCQAKALVSGVALIGGGLLMLIGTALLFAGFRSGTANAAGNLAQGAVNQTPGGNKVQTLIQKWGSKGSVSPQSRSDARARKGAESSLKKTGGGSAGSGPARFPKGHPANKGGQGYRDKSGKRHLGVVRDAEEGAEVAAV